MTMRHSLHFCRRPSPVDVVALHSAKSRDLATTVADIKQAVCQFYEIEEKELGQTKRGWMNKPRNVAVDLARRQCGLRLEDIGKEFGMGEIQHGK